MEEERKKTDMKNITKQAEVIVVKVDEDIGKALKRVFSYLGGLDNLIFPFQTVFIKPNWVSNRPYSTGAITHPELIELCAKDVLKCGVSQVYIGDSSMVGENTEKVIESNNFRRLENRRLKVLDLKNAIIFQWLFQEH